MCLVNYCTGPLYGLVIVNRTSINYHSSEELCCPYTDTGKYDHITPALKALGWLTIEEQLWLRDVTMMYKCVNNLVPAYISCKIGKRSNAHAYNLRNSEDLNLPGCRTAAAQSGFFYRAAKAWNSLSNNTRTARSLRSFKKHAKAELMKK